MGLDSFWGFRRDGQPTHAEHVKLPRELRLIGGMFSDHGEGSFRGKVYDPFVSAVTGVSLYQQEINNVVVRRMADRLDAYRGPSMGLSEQEVADLKTMFRTYADAGCSLYGWW